MTGSGLGQDLVLTTPLDLDLVTSPLDLALVSTPQDPHLIITQVQDLVTSHQGLDQNLAFEYFSKNHKTTMCGECGAWW